MLPGDSDFGSMCQSEGSLNQTSFLSPSIPMLPQLRAVLALLGSCAGTVGGFLSFPLHQCPCSLLFRKGSLSSQVPTSTLVRGLVTQSHISPQHVGTS